MKRHVQKPAVKKHAPKKRIGWIKFFGFLILLSFAVLVGGFLKFADVVSHPEIVTSPAKADGIVVWTGKGGGRLKAASKLLSQGKGERLLISGVNGQNSREDILRLLELSGELNECCVDLDYDAEDTVGNARETAAWAGALGYEHIILVTSAYHMPRAQVEISNAVGRIRITPFPVSSQSRGPWWKDRKQFDRYAQEYGKLLGSFIRAPRRAETKGTPVIIAASPENPTASSENPATSDENPATSNENPERQTP